MKIDGLLFLILVLIINGFSSVSSLALRAESKRNIFLLRKPVKTMMQYSTRSSSQPPYGDSESTLDNRRLFLRGISAAAAANSVLFISSPQILSRPCLAAEGKEYQAGETKKKSSRPLASIEALLPATRCKIWIDQAYNVATKIPLVLSSDENERHDTREKQERIRMILMELNQILGNRPKLFRMEKSLLKKSTPAMAQFTTKVSNADKQQYQSNRSKLFSPTEKISAVLNQADVERQWGILQYAESKREEDNEIRAAFNFYTRQLVFGESYVLTASKEDKKRMIRNDELPTLTDVIRSDLDLRDLYRNQLLTDLEDLQAEVSYQLSRHDPNDTIETADIVDLMDKVYTSCSRWFDLIDSDDVAEALSMIAKEDVIASDKKN